MKFNKREKIIKINLEKYITYYMQTKNKKNTLSN
jgi:hypothetical protein